MSLIGLFVLVIVFGLLAYLVRLLPIDRPFKTIALVLLILILILILCNSLGVLNLSGPIYLRR